VSESRPAFQQSSTSHWQLVLAATFSALFGLAAGVSGQSPPPDSIALQVAEETATLHIVAKSIETTNDKALAVAQALRHGDYTTASTITQDIAKHSRLQAFGFAPFNRFIGALSDADDPDYLTGLNQWVDHEPRSALAHLLRSEYEYKAAWSARGEDFANKVVPEHWKTFREEMERALNDVKLAIKLDPNIPWAYYQWLHVAAGGGDAAYMDEVFRTGIGHFPTYYSLYETRLRFLQPKWFGSNEAMYDFVTQYAGKAPANSPLKLLYLQLSANLLNAAWVSCQELKHEALNECMGRYMGQAVTGTLTDGIHQAFTLYKHIDPIQFNSAIWPILGSLESTRGESTAINSILTVAAEAMGSDNVLIHDAGHNNYVLDDITARIWTHLDNPANVDQKFREALDDVERTTFPSEEDKITARATIFDHMANAARNQLQWVRVIAYHDAANAVGGINHGGTPFYKCFAYYKLNRFQPALDECTRLLDSHKDIWLARYYRARSYEGLKLYDAAIADFAPLAENWSDYYLRTGAALELDHVMALKGDFQGALAVLLKYPFLFDENLQPPEDLAIAYNNRCFGYMKTGQPEKALEDCTKSLRYGKLPDALQKQQQLLKQLGKSPT
jgi:tetratricopeptide (TPR) repeat protein